MTVDNFRALFGYNICVLTQRQKQIYDFLGAFNAKQGFSPTIKEIQRHFRLSSSATVHEHLNKLEKKGYLDKKRGLARAIQPKNPGQTLVNIPLLGTIAAGQPIEAIQERETIAVPKNRIPRSANVYALRVAGDSMINEGVKDGDTILIKRQNTAENGDKVVALLNGQNATLKTFFREKNHIRLQPANENYPPIIIGPTEQLTLQGILIDTIRSEIPEKTEWPLPVPSKTKINRCGGLPDYLNRVYNGDIMKILKDLPDDSVDMVFGDPDYNVGIKYGRNSYTRNFNDYLDWYIELTKESARVLKNDGNLFMMNYPKQNAHLRVRYLDLNFVNVHEYVWAYNTNVGHTPKRFTTAHRSILHVRKSDDNKFYKDEVALPYKNPTDKRIRQNLANGSRGRMPYSWFEFNLVKNVSKEKTYHACQIPQKLTEMLIKATTKPRDVVLILFGGSGSEVEIAQRLNRNFITAEIDPQYCRIIEDRLKKGYIDSPYRLGPHGKKRADV